MQPQKKRSASNACEPVAGPVHDHIRSRKAAKRAQRLRGARGQSLAVLEIKLIVERANRPQPMASFCQAAVPAAARAGAPCLIWTVRERTYLRIEKIAKGIEAGVVAETA